MDSIFTKIINREIPAHIIAEDEYNIAFLDVNPIKQGHTLVVPKKQVDNIFDLDDQSYSRLHLFSKSVARMIEDSFDCKKVGVAVVGLEVPHAHIHLVPINSLQDLDFNSPGNRLKLSQEQLALTAEKIKKYFNIYIFSIFGLR